MVEEKSKEYVKNWDYEAYQAKISQELMKKTNVTEFSVLEARVKKMPKFDDFKNLKDAVGPKIARFEDQINIFQEDNFRFKEVIAAQDKTLLLKANKMAVTELEQQTKLQYAEKQALQNFDQRYDARVSSLE